MAEIEWWRHKDWGTYYFDEVGEVHFGGVVAPSSELEVAVLFVEGVVRDVNLTNSLEHSSRLPMHTPTAVNDRPELTVVAVQIFSTVSHDEGAFYYHDGQTMLTLFVCVHMMIW